MKAHTPRSHEGRFNLYRDVQGEYYIAPNKAILKAILVSKGKSASRKHLYSDYSLVGAIFTKDGLKMRFFGYANFREALKESVIETMFEILG